LGFDRLEGRNLLSHFSGSMSPAWGGSGGHDDGPSPSSFVMMSHSSGPVAGNSGFSAQVPSFWHNGWPPGALATIPHDAPPAPAGPSSPGLQGDAPSNPITDLVASGPAGFAGTGQATDAASAADSPAGSLSIPARPVDFAIGAAPERSTKTTATDEIAVSALSGAGPSAAAPAANAVGGDQIGNAASAGDSGWARSIALPLAASAMAIARPWVITADPFLRAPALARSPRAASVAAPASNESAAIGSTRLPGPRGAGLSTDFGGFGQTPIEDGLTRLFDRSGRSIKPIDPQAQSARYLFTIALSALALEMARRWRRLRTHDAPRSRRSRQFVIKSVF
jgi:hypothetical protein